MGIYRLISIFLFTALSVAPVHANLLTNGSFETGNLSGWTQVLNGGSATVFVNSLPNFPTYDGNWQLGLDTATKQIPSPQIYQDIATTIGNSYTISFALHPNVSRFSSGGFSVAFGLSNQLLGSWSPLDFTATFPNSVELAYQSLSRTFTAVDAITRVSFLWSNAWVLDNTVLTQVASTSPAPSHVPEPSAMLLLASGFMGMVAVRSRRRKS